MNIVKSWQLNILKIADHDYFCKIGDKSKRVFTNITSIPKELRSCLYINDEDLVECDISNSQPLLFNKFLLENYNFDEDLFNDKYDDIKLYIDLTEKGLLYDYLMNEWGLTNRKEFKKDFFASIFYCKINSNHHKIYSKKFNSLFPNVMALILKMKEGHYNNLSIQLQNLEADIIIKGVSTQLFNENINHYTIHDGIMCYKNDAEYISLLIKEKMSLYSLYPIIKIK